MCISARLCGGPGLRASRALPSPTVVLVRVLAPLFECRDEGSRTLEGRLACRGILGPDGSDYWPFQGSWEADIEGEWGPALFFGRPQNPGVCFPWFLRPQKHGVGVLFFPGSYFSAGNSASSHEGRGQPRACLCSVPLFLVAFWGLAPLCLAAPPAVMQGKLPWQTAKQVCQSTPRLWMIWREGTHRELPEAPEHVPEGRRHRPRRSGRPDGRAVCL